MLSNDIPVYVTVNSWETKKKQKKRETIRSKNLSVRSGDGIYIERVIFSVMTHAVFVHV